MNPNPTPNHGGSVDASQHQHPPLPIAQVGMANKQAQIRATLLGIAGGLASAFISRKALKLTGNQAILSGMIAGSGVAYIAARQELEHNLQQLEDSERRLGRHTEMERLDLRSADEKNFEAGVAGLHEYKDKYATTRGDH